MMLTAAFLLASGKVMAEPTLYVAGHSTDLADVTRLGDVEVEGVGRVELTARRNQAQVVVQALGPDRAMLGRAETTVGLAETPVFITTPGGLKKITIYWGSKGK